MQTSKLLTIFMALAGIHVAHAGEGPVTWVDPTCGFFIVKLPDGNPKEAFGLFSWKANPGPQVGDIVEGDIVAGEQVEVLNKRTGGSHAVIHWANAGMEKQLVRNTPVQCASRWKKRR